MNGKVTIKPDEIMSLIRQQIEEYKEDVKVVHVGTVCQVGRWHCTYLWLRQGNGWGTPRI